MHLDGISESEITELNIPTATPLCYELDEDMKPIPHADAIAPLVKDLPGLGLGATVEALEDDTWLVLVKGKMDIAAAETFLEALEDSGVETVAYHGHVGGDDPTPLFEDCRSTHCRSLLLSAPPCTAHLPPPALRPVCRRCAPQPL